MSFFENTRKPAGFGGRIMVSMMNLGHGAMAGWGLRFLMVPTNAAVLDCGCGGGANIKKLLKKCSGGSVKGIDYSPVSVEKSRKVNRRAIEAGRCVVLQASVMKLPFEASQFDLVTAFETVYFWPDLSCSFQEVYRVLKPGGTFFICNESSGDTSKDDKWTEIINGMTIYKDVQLQAAMEQVGFHHVQIHKNQKGWLCVTAQK
ncbi:MAG: class I SAM-dependent methyltransferase [Eubacteriales bacterium]|nr:class I SAM-dependent methyltransferase [Eubacteriales bacterium]